MKVIINITELNILKGLAVADFPDILTEQILAKVRETAEIDITETCRNNAELKDIPTLVALCVVGSIAHSLE